MSGFINLDSLDPFELFGAQIRRSRFAVKAAYDGAFLAWDRKSELLREHQWSSSYGGSAPTSPEADLDRMWDEAIAENVLADTQAAIVVLVASDALQRFIRGVLREDRRREGYGPEYGPPHRGTVKLTELLRTGANSVRHVSEWDDLPWDSYRPWPSGTTNVYPTVADCKVFAKRLDERLEAGELVTRQERETVDRMRIAMQNIEIFQRVFGIGENERIRDPVALRAITQVDGRLGGGTSYERFEAAMVRAAKEVAEQKGPDAATRFDAQLA